MAGVKQARDGAVGISTRDEPASPAPRALVALQAKTWMPGTGPGMTS